MSVKSTSAKSQVESHRQSVASSRSNRTKTQSQSARQAEKDHQVDKVDKTRQGRQADQKSQALTRRPGQDQVSLASEAGDSEKSAHRAAGNLPNFASWASGEQAQSAEAQASVEQDPLKAAVLRTEGRSEVDQQDLHVGYGLQAMLQGNKEGLWSMPYLENIARQGWQQEYGQGRSAQEAPQDYINSWIDAWSGGDSNIPGAKDLNESMSRLGLQTPGAFTPASERKDGWDDPYTLAPRQKYNNDCGVTAARSALRSHGFDADQDALFADAQARGYHDGDAWRGHAKMRDYLQSFGMDSEIKSYSKDNVNAELEAGHPVILSTADHYFAISGKDEKGNYILGETGNVVGLGATASHEQLARYSTGHTLITTGGLQSEPRQPAHSLNTSAPAAPGRAVNPRNLMLDIDERPAPMVSPGIQEWGDNASKAQVNQQLEAAAEKYGIPTDLLKAVAWQESKFDARALSFDAEHGKGVMQIDDRFHEFARTGDYFNSAANIDYGAQFLADLHDRYGSWDTALLRYNGGSDYPPIVRRWERERPWETQMPG